MSWRKSTQPLLPPLRTPTPPGQYDLYPAFSVGTGQIAVGFEALAHAIAPARRVTIDGYGGVFWDDFRNRLSRALAALDRRAVWVNVQQAMRPPSAVASLIAPFLGGDDPLFGTRFTGTLADFFDEAKLRSLRPPDAPLAIIYGCGAALAGWEGLLVYVDLPKNEVQYRARAGSTRNLGAVQPAPPKAMYKRFYFVDWVALNRHKAALLPHIDWIVDAQRPDLPTLMRGDHLRAALSAMSHHPFRVRPWFEPGPWGGQWIKTHIPQLPQDVVNYAWSFELITPENGVLLESSGRLLEVSFDFLMYHAHRAVLGAGAARFGYEFPIRFDFLDTFDGGNLSVQCHPRPNYIRHHFGENFTQDEAYYILDSQPGSRVYLGFQAGVDPTAFRAALEHSVAEGVPVDVDRFVHSEPSHKHAFFLIPHGTVHGSGAGNLVLEISATPYIFTFKMYDWLRLDLDGRPRPLNIARAFENLNFERQGEQVRRELISRPRPLAAGRGWRLIHLPTHPVHFYDVHRYEITDSVEVATENSVHVMSLVEGKQVVVEAQEREFRFNYAETFVIPAATGRYRLRSPDGHPIRVLKVFIKPSAGE